MLTHVKSKSARVLLALFVALLLAGAPIAVSNASAAGGGSNSGGSTVGG